MSSENSNFTSHEQAALALFRQYQLQTQQQQTQQDQHFYQLQEEEQHHNSELLLAAQHEDDDDDNIELDSDEMLIEEIKK